MSREPNVEILRLMLLLETQGAGSDTIREPFKVTSPAQHASR